MTQWIYTEYFNIYTQYVTYFTTVLMLLTSASALSFIKSMDSKKINCSLIFFGISCIIAIIDIYLGFMIFESIRTKLLLMSGKCINFSGEVACDINIQEDSIYLRIGILLLITSFASLIIGYAAKFRGKT